MIARPEIPGECDVSKCDRENPNREAMSRYRAGGGEKPAA
jgi:hypothetical protein